MDKKGFHIVSAILRAQWLIHPGWAQEHLGLAMQILNGTAPSPAVVATSIDETTDRLGYAGRLISNGLAEIEISGPMLKYGGWCSNGTIDYIESINLALQDDRVNAIIVRIDTPGGEVRSIGVLNQLIQRAHKPVVAYIEDMAASAGLYSIAGAAFIVASHGNTEVGSIGVYQSFRDYRAYFEKEGIKDTSVYSRLSTEKNLPWKEAMNGNFELLQDDLDYVATGFIDAVKAGRGDKLNITEGDPFKGKVFFAPEALKIGLIDAIGDYQFAIEKAQELASSNHFQTQFNMFGDKYPHLTALRGVAAADISTEQLEAVNTALEAKGFSGVRVVNAGWIQEAEDLQETASVSAAEVTRLTAELAVATADRDKFKALAEKYGAKPATEPAAPIASGTKSEITDSPSDDKLSETDVALAKLKAQAQL